MDISRHSDDQRNRLIGLMYNGLAHGSVESTDKVLQRAAAVEEAAFKHYKGTNSECKLKLRSLMLNVKANKQLRDRVLSDDIAPDRFVTMSKDEMKTAEQRARDVALEKENLKEAFVPQEEKAIAEGMPCRKCKGTKVTYTQAQTRSADEPMTTFFSCSECQARWRVSFNASPCRGHFGVTDLLMFLLGIRTVLCMREWAWFNIGVRSTIWAL